VPGSASLVVWAENAATSPYDPTTNVEVEAAISIEAQRLGAYFIVGATRSISETEFANVNVAYDPGGRRIGEYLKRHPVPFGEFVPLRGLLDFIPQLDRIPRDMVRGEGPVVFDIPAGVIGSVISFEGGFTRLIRSEVSAGAELMVVTTNESTWVDSEASDQFIDITRVNAAAIGQDLVHAAISGRSAIISAAGDITAVTDLLATDILIGTVRFRTAGPTLFARLGDWVVLAALAASVAALAVPGEGRPGPR
jgi:apolipoprotein N-acyltransferase